MKIRYQMRGLAIGIIVTALLMGVATDEGRPLTDAEIKILASELGMVESDSLKLSDIQNATANPPAVPTVEPATEPKPEPTMEPTAEPTLEPTVEPAGENETESASEQTADSTSEPASDLSVDPTPEPTAEPTSKPATEPVVTSEPAAESVVIVVNPGATSVSVSKLLAEVGLVADANEYDAYLCNNGYSRRIAVGSFEITKGASEEEIAKIITRTR